MAEWQEWNSTSRAAIARIRASNSVCKKSRFPEAADEAKAWNVLSVGRSLTIDLARTWEVTVYVFSMVYNSFDCPFSRARACYTRRARIARNEGVCDCTLRKRKLDFFAREPDRVYQLEIDRRISTLIPSEKFDCCSKIRFERLRRRWRKYIG